MTAVRLSSLFSPTLLVLGLGAPVLRADIAENFAALSPGATPNASNSIFSSNSIGAGCSALGVLDATNRFGSGTSNRLLRITDDSASATARLGRDAGASGLVGNVATFSFVLANDSTGTGNNLGFRLSSGAVAWSTFNFQILFNRAEDGTGLGTTGGTTPETFGYPLGRPLRVQLAINNSSSPQTDYHDSHDLAPGRIDVWMDGERVAAGLEFTDNALGADGLPFRSLSLQTFSSALGVDVTIDDLRVSSGLVIDPPPVPSPGFAAFASATLPVAENHGLLVVPVQRLGGNDGELTVSYWTEDLTAVGGIDFEASSGTLFWGDGEVSDRTILLPIIDNTAMDGDRLFRVHLGVSPPTTQATLLITILSDEMLPDPTIAALSANAVALWTGDGGDALSPRFAEALASLAVEVDDHLATLSAQGRWTDVDYTDVIPDATWTLDRHYTRLQAMALAYATPASRHFRDAALLAACHLAIDAAEQTVHPSTNLQVGNWWWWQIGIPRLYSRALVLLGDDLDPVRRQRAAATLDYLIGPALRNGTDGVQNRIWQGLNRLLAGLIAADLDWVNTGADLIRSNVRLAGPAEEGIMPDLAFQAHGAWLGGQYLSQLATGQYGASFAADVPEFLCLVRGTSLGLNAAALDLVYRYVIDGAGWSAFGPWNDISVQGRAYTRENRSSANVLQGLLRLATFPHARAGDAAAAAQAMLDRWTDPLLLEAAALATRPAVTDAQGVEPQGIRSFDDSDYLVHRSARHFLSLKTISTRNLIGESINGENLRGRHLASGVTWILTGNDYAGPTALPALDHARLPGTTVEAGLNLGRAYHYLPGRRSFVGAATQAKNGVAAMDFASQSQSSDSALVARKSWFLFDDSLVALGSGIATTKALRVETTINQRPLPSLTTPVWVDGVATDLAAGVATPLAATWLHADGMGYVFPGAPTIQVMRKLQTGRWSDLGSGSTTLQSQPYLTLWFDHGQQPSNAGYAYAVLPGATADATAAAAGAYEILQQDNVAHAVRHRQEASTGAAFWQAGTVDFVEAAQPCLTFWKFRRQRLDFGISDPSHALTTVSVRLRGRFQVLEMPADASLEELADGLRVTLPVSAGRTRHFSLHVRALGEESAAATWRRLEFGDDAPASRTADEADPDHDGLPNLVERLTGLSALSPSRLAQILSLAPDALPGATGLLSLRRLTGGTMGDGENYTVAGAQMTLEGSPDLSLWRSGSGRLVAVGSAVGHGDGTETVSFRWQDLPGEQPAHFFRLRVRVP